MLLKLKQGSLRLLNLILIAAVAVLVLDVLLGVASRYLWGAQVKWTEELATILLIWVSFLGAAAAFEARAHLGIDFLTARFTPSARRKAEINRGTSSGIRALARWIRFPLLKSAPLARWADMILSVSSIRVGINRRAMDIIMDSSWTGTRIFFKGFIRDSNPSVSRMGEVV